MNDKASGESSSGVRLDISSKTGDFVALQSWLSADEERIGFAFGSMKVLSLDMFATLIEIEVRSLNA